VLEQLELERLRQRELEFECQLEQLSQLEFERLQQFQWLE